MVSAERAAQYEQRRNLEFLNVHLVLGIAATRFALVLTAWHVGLGGLAWRIGDAWAVMVGGTATLVVGAACASFALTVRAIEHRLASRFDITLGHLTSYDSHVRAIATAVVTGLVTAVVVTAQRSLVASLAFEALAFVSLTIGAILGGESALNALKNGLDDSMAREATALGRLEPVGQALASFVCGQSDCPRCRL